MHVRQLEATPDTLEETFAAAVAWGADSFICQQAAGLNPVRARLAALALQHKLPAIHESRSFTEAGGLLSYGANGVELGRRAATYVDRILRGARPSELRVEQAVRFELVLNLKTATELGLQIPSSLLAQADEVIE